MELDSSRKQRERQSLSLLLGIGSAIVAEIAIYLLGLFLAHERLENLLAKFCFLGGVAHFLKFSSTSDSAKPNHMRLLLPFGGEVLSVVFQKAAHGIHTHCPVFILKHPGGLSGCFQYESP